MIIVFYNFIQQLLPIILNLTLYSCLQEEMRDYEREPCERFSLAWHRDLNTETDGVVERVSIPYLCQ